MAGKSLAKILIIQTAFLGDVILATGLIEKIHSHFPESKIDFLLRKGNESLLYNHPLLNEVIILDKKKKYSHLLKLVKKIRSEKYDLLVNIQRHFTTGLLTMLSGAELTVGFSTNPLSFTFNTRVNHDFKGLHEIDRNHQLIEWFTDNQPSKPKLYPAKENYEKVKSFVEDEPYICIAPASIWFTKQFPSNRWIELISALPEKIKIYLLGGKEDYPLCDKILNQHKGKNIQNLSGKLALLDSAALMNNALVNLVNDSAPMHIASAMNAPTCAIYCSTIPQYGYGPLADDSMVLEISDTLTCRPCGIHGRAACPEKHFNCSKNIDIRPVLDYINELMRA